MTEMNHIKPVSSKIDLTGITYNAVEAATAVVEEAILLAASEALTRAIENGSNGWLTTSYGKLELVIGLDLGAEERVSWEIELDNPLLLIDPDDKDYCNDIAEALETLAKSIREA